MNRACFAVFEGITQPPCRSHNALRFHLIAPAPTAAIGVHAFAFAGHEAVAITTAASALHCSIELRNGRAQSIVGGVGLGPSGRGLPIRIALATIAATACVL